MPLPGVGTTGSSAPSGSHSQIVDPLSSASRPSSATAMAFRDAWAAASAGRAAGRTVRTSRGPPGSLRSTRATSPETNPTAASVPLGEPANNCTGSGKAMRPPTVSSARSTATVEPSATRNPATLRTIAVGRAISGQRRTVGRPAPSSCQVVTSVPTTSPAWPSSSRAAHSAENETVDDARSNDGGLAIDDPSARKRMTPGVRVRALRSRASVAGSDSTRTASTAVNSSSWGSVTNAADWLVRRRASAIRAAALAWAAACSAAVA